MNGYVDQIGLTMMLHPSGIDMPVSPYQEVSNTYLLSPTFMAHYCPPKDV